MLTVSAREANQQFSKLLRHAASGEAVVITQHGKPVAQLVPYGEGPALLDGGAAWDRLTALLEQGVELGGGPFSRDEAHER